MVPGLHSSEFFGGGEKGRGRFLEFAFPDIGEPGLGVAVLTQALCWPVLRQGVRHLRYNCCLRCLEENISRAHVVSLFVSTRFHNCLTGIIAGFTPLVPEATGLVASRLVIAL